MKRSDQSRMTTTNMEMNSEATKGLTEMNSGAGKHVYVVLENGELYPKLYSTYDAAHAAVLHKHADTLEEQRAECAEWNCIMSSKVDVEENRETGTTALYVEKDICITIQRYTVETSQ